MSFSISVTNLNENQGLATVTVTRTHSGYAETVTVIPNTNWGSANNTDFGHSTTFPLTFQSWETFKTYKFTIYNDLIAEQTETFGMSLLDNFGNQLASTSFTIFDDDVAAVVPTVNISQDTSIREADGSVVLNVSLDRAPTSTVSVQWYAAPGSATGGADYTSVFPTNLTWNPGDSLTQQVRVYLANETENIDQSTEYFFVNLQNGNGVNIGDGSATVTILDSYVAPVVTPPNVSISQDTTVRESDGSVLLNITLDKAPTGTVSVQWYAAAGTASGGADYTSVFPTTLTWTPGQSLTQQVRVYLSNEIANIDLASENFFVKLQNGNGVNIVDGSATVTILDSYVAPAVTQPNVSISQDTSVRESDGSVMLNVTLTKAPTSTVSVQWFAAAGTASGGTDYTSVFPTTLTWSPTDSLTKQVKVYLNNEIANVDLASENFFVKLQNGNGVNIVDGSATVTILDSYVTPAGQPTFTITNAGTVTEGGNAQFTVTMVGNISAPTTIYYSTAPGNGSNVASGVEGDYLKTWVNKSITFQPGGSKTALISIPTIIETGNPVEGAETFTVILMNQPDGTLLATGTATIAANGSSIDGAPLLVSTSPGDGATAVAVGSNVTLTFNENVKMGVGSFVIYNANGTVAKTIPVSDISQVTFNNKLVTINPTSDLEANKDYYVKFAAGVIKDIAGNSFAGITTTSGLNFHTAATTTSTISSDYLFSDAAKNGGHLGTAAMLALAAYNLAPGELTGAGKNDLDYASGVPHSNLHADGLRWLTASDLPSLSPISVNNPSFPNKGLLSNGVYVNKNAAALVGVTNDALFISFRGTNDVSAGKGKFFLGGGTPDTDHWFDYTGGNPPPSFGNDEGMAEHYALFADLIAAAKAYIAANPGIKIFVTGHSLGAAMAQKFVLDNPTMNIEAILFASPGFGEGFGDDPRINNLWLKNDIITAGALIKFNSGDDNVIYHNMGGLLPTGDNHYMTKYLKFASFLAENGINSAELRNLDGVNFDRFYANAENPAAADISVGTGKDTIYGSVLSDVILGGDDNDVLSASGFILTNTGANIAFDGKVDRLYGGKGDDTFVINETKDIIIELAGADVYGYDTIQSGMISINLNNYANVEHVALTGNSNLNATGTAANNWILGNSGNNIISGGAGNDRLSGGTGNDTMNGGLNNDVIIGGLGKDTLTGGGDSDTFVFDAVLGFGNIDSITDFSVVNDIIQLSSAIFSAIGLSGQLAASMFNFGTKATQLDDRIIYNSSTGALYYDTNGSGFFGSTQFATIGTGLSLTNLDFIIV